MPTAFLTGGTGFVGGHVARVLVAGGWTVRAPRPRSRSRGIGLARGTADRSRAGRPHRDGPRERSALRRRRDRAPRRSDEGADARRVPRGQCARNAASRRGRTPRLAEGPLRSRLEPGGGGAGRRRTGGRAIPTRRAHLVVRPLEARRRAGRRERLARAVARDPSRRRVRARSTPRLLQYFRMAARGWFPCPRRRTRIQLVGVDRASLAIAKAAGRPDLAGRHSFLCDPVPVTVGGLAAAIAAGAGRSARLVPVPDAVVRALGFLESAREALTRPLPSLQCGQGPGNPSGGLALRREAPGRRPGASGAHSALRRASGRPGSGTAAGWLDARARVCKIC